MNKIAELSAFMKSLKYKYGFVLFLLHGLLLLMKFILVFKHVVKLDTFISY